MAEILNHEGRPAIRMTDHKGKLRTYLFRVERDGTITRYIFEKCGDLADPVYTVTHRPGDWRCTCHAFLYSRAEYKRCKHTNASRDVEAFYSALTPARTS